MKKNSKLRVAVLFGGKSMEHEVSIQSARNVVMAMDKNKYEIILIGIDKAGCWHLCDPETFDSMPDNGTPIAFDIKGDQVVLIAGDESGGLYNINRQSYIEKINVVFPVLHGTFGEDGTVQGVLKSAGIPFVGADVLGSSIGMDKDVSKRLLRDADLPVSDAIICNYEEKDECTAELAVEKLGLPLFIKPANMGSSVGVMKVDSVDDFSESLNKAFEYDNKVLIEKCIAGREIECAILGNEDPAASVLGEIVPHAEFYSYDAKYIDGDGAKLIIPADLPTECADAIRSMAISAYMVLCCSGMARVDFFLQDDGSIFINEINTIPGFTKISMYPQLWAASGMAYSDLIDQLIQLAFERTLRDEKLYVNVTADEFAG
jgi:D-alanine-D-alanine ligase